MEEVNSLLTKLDLLSETTFLVPQIEQITMVDFDEFMENSIYIVFNNQH